MELRSQELFLGSEGEEVSLLYKELRTLDFDILEHEVSSASFGMGIRNIILGKLPRL